MPTGPFSDLRLSACGCECARMRTVPHSAQAFIRASVHARLCLCRCACVATPHMVRDAVKGEGSSGFSVLWDLNGWQLACKATHAHTHTCAHTRMRTQIRAESTSPGSVRVIHSAIPSTLNGTQGSRPLVPHSGWPAESKQGVSLCRCACAAQERTGAAREEVSMVARQLVTWLVARVGAFWCTLVHCRTCWCILVHVSVHCGTCRCIVARVSVIWCILVYTLVHCGTCRCIVAKVGAFWCILVHVRAAWCSQVRVGVCVGVCWCTPIT